MAEHSSRLISKVIESRDINTAINRGVSKDMFQTFEQKRIWEFLTKASLEYGSVPSLTATRKNFPTTLFPKVTDDYDFVLDQFLTWHRGRLVDRLMADAVETFATGSKEDLVLNLKGNLAALDQLSANGATDSEWTANQADRRARYEALKKSGNGLLGLSTGFPTIDLATAGLQPGQLVTIVASPKTGKSTLALKIAHHVALNHGGVLFQTFEMSQKEQEDRLDSISAGVSHSRLTRGTLTADEEKAFLQHLATHRPFQLRISDSRSVSTVSSLSAKIGSLDFHPELVVVDGAYFMTDEATGERNTPQALTGITRSLKALAQRLALPVLISTQALLSKMRKHQLNADSIGYSSSYLQDSDVVLGLERLDDDTPDQRKLRVVESRNCGPVEVYLDWLWEQGQFEEQP